MIKIIIRYSNSDKLQDATKLLSEASKNLLIEGELYEGFDLAN